MFVLTVWKMSASCQKDSLSSVEEARMAPASLSALRCTVRASVSFAFALSVSEHHARQSRRHLIHAHEGTSLRTAAPKSMLC